MHTARMLTVSPSMHYAGGSPCQEGFAFPGGSALPGGWYSSMHWGRPPCEQNHRRLWKYNLVATTLRTVMTIRKWSCGKVMFSKVVCQEFWPWGVYPIMHWAGGCVSQYAVRRGVSVQGDVCSGGVCWRSICQRGLPREVGCLPRGVSSQGVSTRGCLSRGVFPGGVHPTPQDSHCSWRYASYRNAFLW